MQTGEYLDSPLREGIRFLYRPARVLTFSKDSGPMAKAPKKKSASVTKVLIVDDETKILTVAKKLLGKEKYQLLTSEGAEEALDILEEKGPISVFLTDNRMPTMRGTELLEKVKMYAPDTVRIIMTAHFDPQLVEDVVNKGEAFRYLKKPLDFQMVKDTIYAGIEQYQENVKAKALGTEYEKLTQEKSEIEGQSAALDRQIEGLQKGKKTLVVALIGAFICFGLYHIYDRWAHRDKMESTSQEIGDWTKYENGTALDTRTGLMWMTQDFRNLEKRQVKSWPEAMAWPDKINQKRFAGFTDWRVPTVEEYLAIFDRERTKLAFDRKKDFPVGYPRAFEDGGGYGFWSSQQVGLKNAKYFFFIGGYDRTEDQLYANAIMSVRLVRKD